MGLENQSLRRIFLVKVFFASTLLSSSEGVHSKSLLLDPISTVQLKIFNHEMIELTQVLKDELIDFRG